MTAPQRMICAERGRGSALVLLHAFPLSHVMWDAELERFSAIAHVIAPDLYGFGRSPRMPTPSIAAMAAGVVGMLDELGVREPVTLVGLSMGGYVAFEILRQAPGRGGALGVFSTRATADSPQQRDGRFQLIDRIRRDGWGAVGPTLPAKLLGRSTLEHKEDLVRLVSALVQQADPEGVCDALRAMAERGDSTPLLTSIRCPTLVVAGAEDATIPVTDMETMAKAIPKASLAVIQQAGHLVNLEQPAPFHDIVEQWLGLLR